MGDLFTGGAAGVGLELTLKTLLNLIDKARDFNSTLENNTETLDSLTSLVEEIRQFSNELDRPKEVERLENEVKAGRELVNKCSKFRWWLFLLLPYYRDKLQKRDKKLVRYLTVDVQTQIARDTKETLCNVRQILEILMKDYVSLGVGNQLRGLSGPPEKPEFTVRFDIDEPFNKLKIELLKDGGLSILLLTGLGGSGKTTLAKMLCCDDQVKGKFVGNIFFVVVSKTPNLKTIVQTLFENCGYNRVPEFQTGEDAIKQLGNLLRQVAFRESPILLVLDDVWPGSEDLVEKFKFQISNYKILVTSRVSFPRFDTTCILKPLVHEDAVTLFNHYAQLEKNNSNIPEGDHVQKVVGNCKGLPLAIKVIATSLSTQPNDLWQKISKELSQGHSMARLDELIFELMENNL